MPISSDKTRMSLVIEKNDKKTIEEIAKKEDRSANYIINQAIKSYINEHLPDKEE